MIRTSFHSTIAKKYVYLINVANKKVKSFGSNSKSKTSDSRSTDHLKIAYYTGSVAVLMIGLSYASVPLYKVFCQVTGFGGTTQRADDVKVSTVKPVNGGKVIRVDFTGNVHDTLPWKFKATQNSVKLVPGETALAFFTVKNTSSKAITGVATYNVFPPKAGLYFNKIQCFCFEEQRLQAGEEIDMPVFFFIDPDFLKDPTLEKVNTITLSYTFFLTGVETASDISSTSTVTKNSSVWDNEVNKEKNDSKLVITSSSTSTGTSTNL